MTALPLTEPPDEERLPPKACPTGTILAIAPGAIATFPARCKRWSCDPCGKKKARVLAHRIATSRANRFLTLTCRPNPDATPAEQLDMMNAAWRDLWKRFRRRYGRLCRGYVKIVELHASGAPHLHIAIAAPFIPQTSISAAWAELTGSPIVDIRVVRTEQGIARYLSKYLTKATHAVARRRRWSQSYKFLPKPEEHQPEKEEVPPRYFYSRHSLAELHESLLGQGYVLLDNVYVDGHNLPWSDA